MLLDVQQTVIGLRNNSGLLSTVLHEILVPALLVDACRRVWLETLTRRRFADYSGRVDTSCRRRHVTGRIPCHVWDRRRRRLRRRGPWHVVVCRCWRRDYHTTDQRRGAVATISHHCQLPVQRRTRRRLRWDQLQRDRSAVMYVHSLV